MALLRVTPVMPRDSYALCSEIQIPYSLLPLAYTRSHSPVSDNPFTSFMYFALFCSWASFILSSQGTLSSRRINCFVASESIRMLGLSMYCVMRNGIFSCLSRSISPVGPCPRRASYTFHLALVSAHVAPRNSLQKIPTLYDMSVLLFLFK